MWSAITPLMAHQVEAAAKMLPLRVGALFMEMGTGKTRTAIELARQRQHRIRRVVYFCPVSIKQTIAREIAKHTDCAPDSIYVFGARTTARSSAMQAAFWVIVGIESLSSSVRVVSAVQSIIDDQTMVVVDESTYIKGHRAYRTERITLLSKPARYRLIMTGTPFTNGVVDLFAQMRFLSPEILGYNSFYHFAANHLEYEEVKRSNGTRVSTGRIVSSHNEGYLAAKIAPYVYQVKKQDCLDLPSKIYTSYSHSLTNQQRAAYDMAKMRFAEAMMDLEYEVSSLPIFRLFTELQSIVCGFVTVEGSTQFLEHRRVNLLLQVLGDLPERRVVVWAKYHHCIEEIVEQLQHRYGHAAVQQYHGGLNERQRSQQLSQWSGSGQFLVGTQAAGGHGLNELVAASDMIFYANGFKYSERVQAEDRIHRLGQQHKCWYADIYAEDSIDKRIFNSLSSKENCLSAFVSEVRKLHQDGMKEALKKKILEL